MTVTVKEAKGLKGECVCARCPSYSDCTQKGKELLFCIQGKTACKLGKYGCICGMCPVLKARGFKGVYFCLDGKASS